MQLENQNFFTILKRLLEKINLKKIYSKHFLLLATTFYHFSADFTLETFFFELILDIIKMKEALISQIMCHQPEQMII